MNGSSSSHRARAALPEVSPDQVYASRSGSVSSQGRSSRSAVRRWMLAVPSPVIRVVRWSARSCSGLAPPTPEIEQERRVAIFDLLEENRFALPPRDGREAAEGPYRLHLAIRERRLVFEVAREDGETVAEKAEPELFGLRHLSVGKVAPDIEGQDQDGVKFKLSDYRGKVVLLDFWSEY